MHKLIFDTILIACEAAAAIMEVRSSVSCDLGVEIKQDNTPVTLADLASNNIICSYLNSTLYPTISEESPTPESLSAVCKDRYWLVDPLDGTRDFIRGSNEFTVNIALIEHHTPIFGVLVAPALGFLWFGMKGVGSYELPLERLSQASSLDELLSLSCPLPYTQSRDSFIVASSISFPDSQTQQYIDKLCSEHTKSEIRYIGSSLKFIEVARHNIDSYPRLSSINTWDIAAGAAIATACGAHFTDLESGQEYSFDFDNLKTKPFECSRAYKKL